MNDNRDRDGDRRKVSPAGRERWEEFQREKLEIDERLRLVEVQNRVIEHVTNPTRQ